MAFQAYMFAKKKTVHMRARMQTKPRYAGMFYEQFFCI